MTEARIRDMHDPAPAGEVLALLAGWLADLKMTATALAAHLGISRVLLSRILHGHAAITADIDLRWHEALGTSPGFWLRMQTQRELWLASERAKERAPVARIAARGAIESATGAGARR